MSQPPKPSQTPGSDEGKKPQPSEQKPRAGVKVKAPKEYDINQLPEDFKGRQFSYRFNDKIFHVTNPVSARVVKSLPENHPLRLQLAAATTMKSATKLKMTLKASCPQKYSLETHVKRILNQGKIGACVSHSAVQALHLIMEKSETQRNGFGKLLWSTRYTGFNGSRLYLYDNARRIDGTPLSDDSGTTNYSACLALEKYKICSEETWPYTTENLHRFPPHEAYVEADKFKKCEYSRIDSNVEAFKESIYNGGSIMAGIVVFPSTVHGWFGGPTW